MRLVHHPPGEQMPAGEREQVLAAFAEQYGCYHYRAELCEPDHDRYTVINDGAVCGYAALHRQAGYAVLKSLLVLPRHRGQGVSGMLEGARMQTAALSGLTPYVSCVAESAASQALKYRHGLRPVAVRLGYRPAGEGMPRGNSVVFSSPHIVRRTRGLQPGVQEAAGLRRARCIGVRTWQRWRSERGSLVDDWYVDVLAPEWAPHQRVPAGLAHHGYDVDLAQRGWAPLLQERNAAYRAGREALPGSPAGLWQTVSAAWEGVDGRIA